MSTERIEGADHADNVGLGEAREHGGAHEHSVSSEHPEGTAGGQRSPARRLRGQQISRSRRTRLTITASVCALALVGGATWAALAVAQPTQPVAVGPAEPVAVPLPEPEPEPIRIMAMGDMLPHDSVNANALQADGSYSYGQFFDGIMPYVSESDAVFCNQEAPSAGVDLGISGYPAFNAPVEFAADLNSVVGCNLVSLANNHLADRGAPGLHGTRAVWDGLEPLSLSGANRSAEEQATIQYADIRGVRTALVAFAEYSNLVVDGVSVNFMADTALVERLIGEARANAQLVLVSAHWGTEDTHEPNAAQRTFAQQAANLGADVVIGTGPHVLQPVEWLDRASGGQTLVWYSIGNMLSSQLTLDQRSGVVASFEVVPAPDGVGPATIADPAALLTYMHYDWTAEQEAAGDLLARNTLSITPLAEADELLQRTRFGVAAADQVSAMTAVLGANVRIDTAP